MLLDQPTSALIEVYWEHYTRCSSQSTPCVLDKWRLCVVDHCFYFVQCVRSRWLYSTLCSCRFSTLNASCLPLPLCLPWVTVTSWNFQCNVKKSKNFTASSCYQREFLPECDKTSTEIHCGVKLLASLFFLMQAQNVHACKQSAV